MLHVQRGEVDILEATRIYRCGFIAGRIGAFGKRMDTATRAEVVVDASGAESISPHIRLRRGEAKLIAGH